ncbi:hypothetical protein [Acidithiobacillus sp. AMEEHan]|uniref:COG4315 family predicted lipoprotein n=1 Tax=Acidithiobacillus sp. AMEEHan TaxID=2994951 RepID=UPI0035B41255
MIPYSRAFAFTMFVSGMLFSLGAEATPSPVPVQLHKAKVAGRTTEVLAGTNGKTLYYFTHDTRGVATCSGSCASLWPPLLSRAQVARHVTGIPGVFSSVKGPNGLQVDYNGHPLYYYAPDTRAGEALGNGLFGGTWWAATPKLAYYANNETVPPAHSSW